LLGPVPGRTLHEAGRARRGGKSATGSESGREIVSVPGEQEKESLRGTSPRVRDGRSEAMKTVQATGAEREIPNDGRATMESSIVDTMRRYFQNDTGKTRGDLEYTIINSVKRYFEGKPPERS
jgi:hypothetical protein